MLPVLIHIPCGDVTVTEYVPASDTISVRVVASRSTPFFFQAYVDPGVEETTSVAVLSSQSESLEMGITSPVSVTVIVPVTVLTPHCGVLLLVAVMV